VYAARVHEVAVPGHPSGTPAAVVHVFRYPLSHPRSLEAVVIPRRFPSSLVYDPTSVSDPAEADLVARIQAGDAAVFSALFTEHFGSLCGLVMSYVKNAAVAEELVQDLFCAIWTQRATWRPLGKVRHYLLVAARNRAISHLRHHRVV